MMVKKVYLGLAEKKREEKARMMSKIREKAQQKAAKEATKQQSVGQNRNPAGQRHGRGLVANKPKPRWVDLLDKEHASAIISDSFWYVICTICNPKKEFLSHKEFLLDRMAANFVSFMLVEQAEYEEKEYQKAKDQFFRNFYDIISQAVFYTLYLAYPKSRQMLDEGFKRKLTDTFSQLYTGNVIHSAEYGHWDNLGGGQAYHQPKTLL